MENGYEVVWSKSALERLKKTYEYLEDNWSENAITALSQEIERTVNLISQNPILFQKTNKKNIRRAVILKLNSIFYDINQRKMQVTVTTFFSNRQDPKKLDSPF